MVDENTGTDTGTDTGTATPPAPRRKGLVLTSIIVGGVVVLGGVFGSGVAVGTALDMVHFGPGMHQGQQGHGYFGGQRFGGRDDIGGQHPGFRQNGSGGTGQGGGGGNGQQIGPRTGNSE